MLRTTNVAAVPGNGISKELNALRLLRMRQGFVAVYQQGERLVFEMGPYSAHLVTFPSDWHRLGDDELADIGRALAPKPFRQLS